MVLADTSIWIDHYRRGDSQLIRLLDRGEIVMHPFVIGELALGHVWKDPSIVADLRNLPSAVVANEEEILGFIIRRKLSGRGIGYVDVHLLAAVALTPATLLWTRDRRLRQIARSSALAFADQRQ